MIAVKELKGWMQGTISEVVRSITTARTQTLYLTDKDIEVIRDKRVLIVDDVVSTGASLVACRTLIARASGVCLPKAVAAFTEGDEREDVITYGHLPLYSTETGTPL